MKRAACFVKITCLCLKLYITLNRKHITVVFFFKCITENIIFRWFNFIKCKHIHSHWVGQQYISLGERKCQEILGWEDSKYERKNSGLRLNTSIQMIIFQFYHLDYHEKQMLLKETNWIYSRQLYLFGISTTNMICSGGEGVVSIPLDVWGFDLWMACTGRYARLSGRQTEVENSCRCEKSTG